MLKKYLNYLLIVCFIVYFIGKCFIFDTIDSRGSLVFMTAEDDQSICIYKDFDTFFYMKNDKEIGRIPYEIQRSDSGQFFIYENKKYRIEKNQAYLFINLNIYILDTKKYFFEKKMEKIKSFVDNYIAFDKYKNLL